MLSDEQIKVIDTYVSSDYFDTGKLKKYLNMHDTVGNEVFAYCDLNKGRRGEASHSYANYLDDEMGFYPLSVERFVKRIPFYFYITPLELGIFGSLRSVLSSLNKKDVTTEEELEAVYEELEFLFYDKGFSLQDIFSYMVDQYGLVTAPFMSWAEYVHICDEIGWDDYFPAQFISKYNYALEAIGREPIIYEVEEQPYSVDMYFRNGRTIEFQGQFPLDEDGRPVLRWTNIKVKNAESIVCRKDKSKSVDLKITITPYTIIYGKNFYNGWEEDAWYQVYAGPLTMSFDYTVLKDKRKKLGFTQQEVADAIGATVRTYQKWEGGETTPDGHYLLRLMNWLDLPDPQYVTAYTEG